MSSDNRTLVPEAKRGLEKFKNEVAQELGVPFKEYNGNLSSRQCGSVGGLYLHPRETLDVVLCLVRSQVTRFVS